MTRTYLLLLIVAFLSGTSMAQTKLDQDRKSIKEMAGFYKVTFNYAETFAPDSAYKFHPRYQSWGHEWVTVVEDSPKKISLQHLLVVGDSMVIKHWRQDWSYEDPTLLVFDKENTWKKLHLNAADVKGKWTQRVFQVDDSPRYESTGTWVHVDGRHQWQSETDSPLPRREFTKRNDYNVLRRGNRVYFTETGWMFEQDNKKIVRGEKGDKLLAMEKGYEEFIKADPSKFTYAQKWWNEQGTYWKDIRSVWDEVFAKNDKIHLQNKKDGKTLFERLFELGDQSSKEKWASTKNKSESRAVIASYLQ
ncbi:DUF6607 family protein [Desertivirga arenae]|uniref:DUF6607 family protein n=1 Tax=Desertivirga arenae TaxID=2810309 RepID=UPI001A958110|nr:DUF6607 family protein [Pedobacter sp. SYSU D00823]